MSTVRSAAKKAVRKKTASRNAKLARPLPKKMGSESKSNRLVCRYCGSQDLAPSFIKRRDRRCRKCFSKRYGSAARAKDACCWRTQRPSTVPKATRDVTFPSIAFYGRGVVYEP